MYVFVCVSEESSGPSRTTTITTHVHSSVSRFKKKTYSRSTSTNLSKSYPIRSYPCVSQQITALQITKKRSNHLSLECATSIPSRPCSLAIPSYSKLPLPPSQWLNITTNMDWNVSTPNNNLFLLLFPSDHIKSHQIRGKETHSQQTYEFVPPKVQGPGDKVFDHRIPTAVDRVRPSTFLSSFPSLTPFASNQSHTQSLIYFAQSCSSSSLNSPCHSFDHFISIIHPVRQ